MKSVFTAIYYGQQVGITIVATKYFKISRFDWIIGNEKQITHSLCYWRLVCYMYIVFITF